MKKQEARLDDFCKANDLLIRNDRVRVVGFGKSVSQKAVHGSKRYASAKGSGIFNKKKSSDKASSSKVKTVTADEEIWGKSKKSIDNSQENDIINLDDNFRKIKGEHSAETDIGPANKPACNPEYGIDSMADTNCGNCALAYELRRRGYDVEAELSKGMTISEWKRLFKDGRSFNLIPQNTENLHEELVNQLLEAHEDGARGSVYVKWKGDNEGHFFSWEIQKGQLLFRDAQSGLIDAQKHFTDADPRSVISIRWDNLQPSKNIVGKCRNKVKQ